MQCVRHASHAGCVVFVCRYPLLNVEIMKSSIQILLADLKILKSEKRISLMNRIKLNIIHNNWYARVSLLIGSTNTFLHKICAPQKLG